MTRQRSSLAGRLVRSALVWALPLLLFVALVLTWLYRANTYRIFDEPLESTVTALIALAETRDGEMTLQREPLDLRYQRALSGRYWIVGDLDETGRIAPLVTSRSLYEDTLGVSPRAADVLMENTGELVRTQTLGPDGEPLRMVARTVILPGLNRPLVIGAAADLRRARGAVREFGLVAAGLMVLLATGLVLAIRRQVRTGLAPLYEIGASVADVREGRAARVAGDYPREIEPLAEELNSLIDHNKTVVERARTHVGNLAHALKTPLAVLQNETDAGQTLSADIVARQATAMRAQVDHHLRRARAAATGQTIGAGTQVAPALAGLVRTLEKIHRGRDIHAHIEPDLVFRGERRDLEEMVGNLLDNACKWATGRVSLRANTAATGTLSIRVEDDGPGIATGDRNAALKRGIRLDEAVPGTGFGLAIVDDLATAYGGSLTLGRSDMGGLSATLDLPARIPES